MVLDNKKGFFCSSGSPMYVYNAVEGHDGDMLKISCEGVIKKPVFSRPYYTTRARVDVVAEEELKQKILEDEGSYVVKLTEPSTAQFCFVDHGGHHHDGILASVLPNSRDGEEGLYFSTLSDKQLHGMLKNYYYEDRADKDYHYFGEISKQNPSYLEGETSAVVAPVVDVDFASILDVEQ